MYFSRPSVDLVIIKLSDNDNNDLLMVYFFIADLFSFIFVFLTSFNDF